MLTRDCAHHQPPTNHFHVNQSSSFFLLLAPTNFMNDFPLCLLYDSLNCCAQVLLGSWITEHMNHMNQLSLLKKKKTLVCSVYFFNKINEK